MGWYSSSIVRAFTQGKPPSRRINPTFTVPLSSSRLRCLAGDDAEAVRVAAQLVRDAGCEPVLVGDLAAASSFQRGGPGFRANTTAPELRRLLGLPEGSCCPRAGPPPRAGAADPGPGRTGAARPLRATAAGPVGAVGDSGSSGLVVNDVTTVSYRGDQGSGPKTTMLEVASLKPDTDDWLEVYCFRLPQNGLCSMRRTVHPVGMVSEVNSSLPIERSAAS